MKRNEKNQRLEYNNEQFSNVYTITAVGELRDLIHKRALDLEYDAIDH